jgi:arylsulfatase A-like enzyme
VAPRVVEGGVGLVDVAPTVLALLGLPAPQRMQGRSLLPALLGAGQDLAAPRFSELDRHVRLRSVVDASHHLILDLDASRQLLFDLDADPTEQRDLAAGEEQRARRLTGSIVRHFKALPTPSEVPEHELSPEKLEQLRALGYLDG